MMELVNLKKQHGAVLAFSLVMLLLLTLTSVSLIQQNRQQLEIATNARLSTQQFANTERVLQIAKNMINTDISHDNTASNYFPTDAQLPYFSSLHACTPLRTTVPYKQNIMQPGLLFETKDSQGNILESATILETSCKTELGLPSKCVSYNPTNQKITCHPESGVPAVEGNCTGKTIEEISNLFTNVADVCYQRYDPQCESNPIPCSALPAVCPKEVYKIKTFSKDEFGTIREIESDYVMSCGS